MYCEHCKVTVRGSYSRCPLCQQHMTGQKSEQVYPDIAPPAESFRTVLRFAIFFSLAVTAVCVALNVMYPAYGWWSVFVAGGMGSFWLFLTVLLRKKGNIHKAIIWLVAIVSLLSVAWDVATGFRGWSVDFVIPIMCTGAMVAMAVIAQIIRLQIEDYLIYMVMDSILGVLCVLLIVFDLSGIVLPAVICVAASILSLSALMIFEGRALRAELRRRLHL